MKLLFAVAGFLLASRDGVLARPREASLLQVANAKANPQGEFESWTREHGKEYTAEEHDRRFEIWKDNLEFVHTYNAEHTTHWLDLGPHADLTRDEYASQLLGFSGTPVAAPSPFPHADVDSKDLPEEIDWRKEGAVTHVKNQKQCGSCWAFSTTGAIEGINAIYTGTLEVLSEQELIDCDTKHDHGCNGGLMDTAFEWVVKNGGIDTENDYKYHAQEGICSVNRRKREVVTIDSYADVPSEDEGALKKAVAAQPVAIAVQANQRAFQLYAGGVFTEECGTQLDHGVLIAGYGTENGTDYWLIKNSWGPAWGDRGYIKLEREEGGAGPGKCGLAVQPSIPIKKHDNPPRPPKPAPDPPPPAPAPSPAPGPSPEPVQCDAQSACFPGTTCCCQQLFLQVCVQWACCPIPEATCCDDHIHCCPKQLPICDVDEGRCLPKGPVGRSSGLFGMVEGAPMVEKVPAFAREAAQLQVQDNA